MPVVTASGMGAVNAALLASDALPASTKALVRFWASLRPAAVHEPRSLWGLVGQLVRHAPSARQSLLDPSPLRARLADRLGVTDATAPLPGVADARQAERLDALALTATRYATLQTVTWTQGQALDPWPHARRQARATTLTLDHVMAAAALPLLYPAVDVEGGWHGAGVGMLRPLAPALRLGARRLLVVSTRAEASEREPEASGSYPSPLQVASILSNTLLLDTVAADAAMLRRLDRLGQQVDAADREGLAPTGVFVLRPSVPLTDVARATRPDVGQTLGAVLRYLHAEGDALPDLLSLLLYDPAYLRRLLLLGYADARNQHDRLAAFFEGAGLDASPGA